MQFKCEKFRKEIRQLSRESYFRVKRCIKYYPDNEQHQDLYQLQEAHLDIKEIMGCAHQLYNEFTLFPERTAQVIAKLKILSVKLVCIDVKLMNDFFEFAKNTFLQPLFSFCTPQYSEDPTHVELTNHALWILINLSLAENSIRSYYLTQFYTTFLQLFRSKYEAIVHKTLELLFNILTEQESCDFLLRDPDFEAALLYRLERANPKSITQQAGQCIKVMCLNVCDNAYLPKIIMFVHYCINDYTASGLVQIIQQNNALWFIAHFKGLLMRLVNQPREAIAFINHLSTMNDDVLDAMLEYPIVEQLWEVRKIKELQLQVFSTIGNLAQYQPSHERLIPFWNELRGTYNSAEYRMKVEIIHFIYQYIQECSVYKYDDLVEYGVVEILTDSLKSIYDNDAVEKVLISLQHIFQFVETARFRFNQIGGRDVVAYLSKNERVFHLVQAL